MVVFDYHDRDNLRLVNVGGGGRSWTDLALALGKRTLGCDSKRRVQNGKVEQNKWYDVRIEVRGATATCIVDGKTFTNSDDRLTTGRIALHTDNSAAAFRDIKVTTPDGKTLWGGLPKPPGSAGAAAAVLPAMEKFPNAEVMSAGTKWVAEGDEIVQPMEGGNLINAMAFGDPSWKDYDVDIEVQGVNKGYVYVAANCANISNFLFLSLGIGPNTQHALFNVQDSVATNWSKSLASCRQPVLEPGIWYPVHIEVRPGQNFGARRSVEYRSSTVLKLPILAARSAG